MPDAITVRGPIAPDQLGVTMTLSTLATTTLEEVAAAATVPAWFQLYVYRDRALTRELVARAVLLGRPLLWGLALDGESGARHVLELLAAELDLALALCGASHLDDLTADLVR